MMKYIKRCGNDFGRAMCTPQYFFVSIAPFVGDEHKRYVPVCFVPVCFVPVCYFCRR